MSRATVFGILLIGLTAASTVSAPDAAAWTPEDARLAACDFAREVAVYDYAALDGYFQRVLDRSTGKFASEFSASMPALEQSIQQTQARSWLESAECGTIGGDQMQQQVLVNTVKVTTSAESPEPQRLVTAFTATVANVWGRWLVSEIAPATS